MQQVIGSSPDRLCLRPSVKPLRPVAPKRDRTVLLANKCRRWCKINQPCLPAKRPFSVPCLSYIRVRAKPPHHLPLLVFQRQNQREKSSKSPISSSHREFHIKRLAGSDATLPALQHPRQ